MPPAKTFLRCAPAAHYIFAYFWWCWESPAQLKVGSTKQNQQRLKSPSSFLSRWICSSLCLCWHRERWWDWGGTGTSIPLVWGLLGALVIQALLPSELCQAPGAEITVILKNHCQPTHFKLPRRWLPPVSKSRQDHLWMIPFLAI